ncbi:MAG: malto-oligosyltrehalose synthase [Nitriliruptoraceae bacterium]
MTVAAEAPAARPVGTGPLTRPVLSTYRLQLHDDFTFADAERIVPRLAELGISHLYLSPCLEAVPGSMHGYDVIDPGRIRESLGGRSGLRALATAAHAAGLGLVLDIVPNHVGLVSPDNPWWWDVLTHGPEGRYGRHFDVHWRPGAHGQPTLLVPELGEPLAAALEQDVLQLAHVDDDRDPAWRVVYYEHAWPVAPGTLADAGFDADDVATTVATCRDDRARFRDLLDRQHYRLGFWRRANQELDHRRFFDIDTLGAVRVEDPAVFADVHAAILPLVADGTLDGLRIDHPDGLADPVGYLADLRRAVGDDAYLVVEKILEHGERFRSEWPVAGTVGYEFAAATLGLHLDPAAGPILDDLQARLTGSAIHRGHLVDEAKRAALDALFGAEHARLTELAAAVVARDRAELTAALTELLVAWPVYRTYLRPGAAPVDRRDAAVVAQALAHGRARAPALAAAMTDLADVLTSGAADAASIAFVTAFQQLTGPAIAKGFEDTVLYRDLRCTAVNEVGADPAEVGTSVAELHGLDLEVAAHRPATMRLSTSHDTKRSEDVRARLAVLAQRPGWWVATVDRLRSSAAGARSRTDENTAATPAMWPLPVHEHLAWQTVVGAWPIDAERLGAYLVKAAREGKEATDWLTPDTDYEAALERYATALTEEPALVAIVEEAVAEIDRLGAVTSLAMTVTKLTAPGVPDTYQGTEVWNRSLVDPDNRRPVDHDRLAALASELAGRQPSPELAAELLADLGDGRAKLWVTRQALRLRREHPELLGPGASYAPLVATGQQAREVWACVRGGAVVAITPCRIGQLKGTAAALDLGDTQLCLPEGTYHDVLAGRRVGGGRHRVTSLLAGFPVALYLKE